MQDNCEVSLWQSSCCRRVAKAQPAPLRHWKLVWSRCAGSWPRFLHVLLWAGGRNVDCVCPFRPTNLGGFCHPLFRSRHSTCLSSLFKISLFLLTLLCPCLNRYLASGRSHMCVFNCGIKLYMNKIGVARGRLGHGHLLTPLQIFWNLQLSGHELSSLKCLSSLL